MLKYFGPCTNVVKLLEYSLLSYMCTVFCAVGILYAIFCLGFVYLSHFCRVIPLIHQMKTFVLVCQDCLQCFDTVGWEAGRAYGL